MTTEIPQGYWKDAAGRLIPESMIQDIDKARNDLVIELAKLAQQQSASLLQFKRRAFADILAFVDLSAERYNVKLGGRKGNLTLSSFDGRFKVQIAMNERMVFDERLQAAKALIGECIIEWAKESSDNIKMLVQDAFQTDKEGKINTGRVLGLRRVKIEDEKWQRAMLAIGESLSVDGSKEYVRFYERVGEQDTYKPISLDIASM